MAQEEVRLLNHNYLGTEHLLLGLLRVGGVAARALASLGISLQAVSAQVEEIIGRGTVGLRRMGCWLADALEAHRGGSFIDA